MFIKNEQKRLAYQMLVFDEVVQKGSFTAAAKSLGHTKSAVSHYISQLEDGVGVRLLNRSTRKLNLTVIGQQFAERSQQLLELLTETLEDIQEHQQAPSGRIAITAPHAFDGALVTPIIAQLCSEYPNLQPELLFSDQRLDLLENKLDLAVSVGPQKDSAYRAVAIGRLDSILVASPQYLAQTSVVTADNLGEKKIVQLPWQEQSLLQDKQGKSITFSSKQLLKVNTSISAVNSVKCALGIGLMPTIFVQSDLDSGQLQRVLPAFQGEVRDVYALHSYQQQLPPLLRRFINKLKSTFAQVNNRKY
ncbi:LysR family transcriptional regulator [Psychromonas ossibalaenae]|uniref:LysR family transcriptional regulator n=1 Tax=Psychromonas ossibalaenae TaxID=444922 RepID=UPI001FDEF700|nr:LysR family transcriptional regulator [Psychromonas ossibalaenae]